MRSRRAENAKASSSAERKGHSGSDGFLPRRRIARVDDQPLAVRRNAPRLDDRVIDRLAQAASVLLHPIRGPVRSFPTAEKDLTRWTELRSIAFDTWNRARRRTPVRWSKPYPLFAFAVACLHNDFSAIGREIVNIRSALMT